MPANSDNIVKFPTKKDDLIKLYGNLMIEAIKINKSSLQLLKTCVEARNALLGVKLPPYM